MPERRNVTGLIGLVFDLENNAWLVLSPDMETVMSFHNFDSAVTYAKEVEGWR